MFHFGKPLHDTLPATRSLRISSALPIKEATQIKLHNMWLTVDHVIKCFFDPIQAYGTYPIRLP